MTVYKFLIKKCCNQLRNYSVVINSFEIHSLSILYWTLLIQSTIIFHVSYSCFCTLLNIDRMFLQTVLFFESTLFCFPFNIIILGFCVLFFTLLTLNNPIPLFFVKLFYYVTNCSFIWCYRSIPLSYFNCFFDYSTVPSQYI